MRGLRRVGKGACCGVRSRTPALRDFAHAVKRRGRTAWAKALAKPCKLRGHRRAFAHPTALVVALFLGSAALAQQPLPRIWDVQLPSAVSDLPDEEFVDPACGTNGGPPGLAIGSFERFERCRPEASGLREIWFRYDDEWELIARAARDPDAIARNNAMVVLGQPVTLSLLIDRAGLVQGYRIFTDPRADEELRAQAYGVAIAFKARFGTDGWTCSDTPAAEGETPILGIFVKERCEKAADGLAITVERRHYYKPGQAMLDPNTGLPTVNQFESSARLQVVRIEALRK
jgi:hypothetical protein